MGNDCWYPKTACLDKAAVNFGCQNPQNSRCELTEENGLGIINKLNRFTVHAASVCVTSVPPPSPPWERTRDTTDALVTKWEQYDPPCDDDFKENTRRRLAETANKALNDVNVECFKQTRRRRLQEVFDVTTTITCENRDEADRVKSAVDKKI